MDVVHGTGPDPDEPAVPRTPSPSSADHVAAGDDGPGGDDLPPRSSTSRGRRILGGLFSLLLVGAVFGFLVPKLSGGASLGEAKAFITPAALAVTLAFGLVNLVSNWPPICVSLPGLRLPQAGVANLSAAAVSNTVPEGGAIATGMTYAILHSWGFSVEATTISILTTGVWTNLVRYSLFAVALLAVALGAANGSALAGGALVVVLVMATAVTLFVLVLRREGMAAAVGRGVGRLLHPVQRLVHRPASDTEQALIRFRTNLVTLVHDRWGRLTGWMILSQLSAALVLLVALRSVGIGSDEVSVAMVFVAYTGAVVAALVVPTPGGVGVAEASYLAILTPCVAPDQSAALLAAVVMFRMATWLLPIPLGAGTYLYWRHNASWRQPSGRPQPAS